MENESAREGSYAIVLSELKAKRAKLAAEILKIDTAIEQIKDMGDMPPIPIVVVTTSKREPVQQNLPVVGGKLADMTIIQAIQTVISKKGKAIHTKEILEKIIEGGVKFNTPNPLDTVNATLYKLQSDGKIKKVARAMWEIIY